MVAERQSHTHTHMPTGRGITRRQFVTSTAGVAAGGAVAYGVPPAAAAGNGDWPAFGYDASNRRYNPNARFGLRFHRTFDLAGLGFDLGNVVGLLFAVLGPALEFVHRAPCSVDRGCSDV